MAITIQELIASDTISQVVDKINFNFDQLLLNGGGPLGPAGPIGPSGPIGGRGERGTEWYEGTDSPNVTPPTVTPLTADYYLQSNGDVWEYTGLTWTNTGINLTGPQGAQGAAVGWSQFGNSPNPGDENTNNYSATSSNVSYPSLMNDPETTISQSNQGVPTVAFGIAGPNDVDPKPGVVLDGVYQLSELMAGQLDASRVSVLIHQPGSGASAIKFMGGATVGENFEQSDLAKLSHVNLTSDDTLNIIVPKEGTNGGTPQDFIGFNIDTVRRGQQFRSGNGFDFVTGTKTSTDFAGDTSNVNFNIKSLTGGSSGEFNVTTAGSNATNEFIIGPQNFPPVLDPSFTGGISLKTNNFGVASNADVILRSNTSIKDIVGNNTIGVSTLGVIGNTDGSSKISFNASGSGNIELLQTGNADIEIEAQPSGRVISSVGDNSVGIDLNGVSILSGDGIPSANSILINAGYVGEGGLTLLSKDLDISINAEIDGNNTTNINLSSNGRDRINILGANGRVVVGGDTTLANGAPLYPTLLINPDASTFPTGVGVASLPTIVIGDGPRNSNFTTGNNSPKKFYGGAEIIGPYGSSRPAIIGTFPVSYLSQWQVEQQAALHIRSGLTNTGKNTGAIWIYNSPGITPGGAGIPDGSYYTNSLRLWGTSTNVLSTAGGQAPGGTTIGLNANDETTTVGGANVRGRIGLYGQSSKSPVLSQNEDYLGNDSQWYASVNVGDNSRGRQTFKVWGDYVGDPYISKFGGAWSGPGIEAQTIMSGAQGWGSYITNQGSNNNDDDFGFGYRYQWHRVGRVVTVSGMIRTQVNRDSAAFPVGSNEAVNWGSNATAVITIGPIPLPIQVNSIRNKSDNDTLVGTNAGVLNQNIAGTVVGVLDVTSRSITARASNGSASNITWSSPMTTGVVGAGSSTTPYNVEYTAQDATHMWIKMYPQNAVSVGFGYIPSYMKFTATYELRP